MSSTSAKLDAQFNRVHISLRDFAEAKDYLDALKGRRHFSVKRALLLAAVISYARPFTQNEKSPSLKAVSQLPVNASKELDAVEHDLHTRLLALRNQALAHSEFSAKPVARVMGTSRGFVSSAMPFDLLSQRIDLTLFRSMCVKLEMYCHSKLFELNHRLGPKALT
jgi:hypothetical protein